MKNRLYFDIVATATGIACAIALLVAGIGAAAGTGEAEAAAATVTPAATQESVAPPPPPATATEMRTYEGMVTCSRCNAKHSPAIARAAGDCVRVCVHGGAQFALVDGDAVYMLKGDTEQLKKVAGERAKITGAIDGNIINVSSVATGG